MYTQEKLKKSIQIVETNINILSLEINKPGRAICNILVPLEHENHVLELLQAEAEGRLYIEPVPPECYICREKGGINIECSKEGCIRAKGGKNDRSTKTSKTKNKLFCLGRRKKKVHSSET